MKQTITITVGNFKDRILAEDIQAAMDAIAPTLRSIDVNMWGGDLGHPRYEWRIEQASKNSPLKIILYAFLLIADAPEADVASAFLKGYSQLAADKFETPPHWTKDDLRRATEWQSVLSRGSKIELTSGKNRVVVDDKVVKNAKRLLKAAPELDRPGEKYGSLTGTIRQVTVDPEGSTSKRHDFVVLDDDTSNFVVCEFDSERAREVHATDRLTVYGIFRFGDDGNVARVEVEDFRLLPTRIPSLTELQDMDIDITNGEDVVDYINRLRGNV